MRKSNYNILCRGKRVCVFEGCGRRKHHPVLNITKRIWRLYESSLSRAPARHLHMCLPRLIIYIYDASNETMTHTWEQQFKINGVASQPKKCTGTVRRTSSRICHTLDQRHVFWFFFCHCFSVLWNYTEGCKCKSRIMTMKGSQVWKWNHRRLKTPSADGKCDQIFAWILTCTVFAEKQARSPSHFSLSSSCCLCRGGRNEGRARGGRFSFTPASDFVF